MVGSRAAVVGLLVLASSTAALGLDPLPDGVAHATAVHDGQDIHVVGGFATDGGAWMRFDPLTRQATSQGALETQGARAVWTGQHIVLFGGVDGSARTVQLIDPTNGTVTPSSAVLPENDGLSAVVWDGAKAYLFLRSVVPMPVYVYVPATDQVAPAGGALWEGSTLAGVGAFHDGRYIWLLGGAVAGLPSPVIWKYDPSMDRLGPTASPLPTALAFSAAAFNGHVAFLAGGLVGPLAHPTSDIFVFDPAAEAVDVIEDALPAPLMGASAVWADDLYVFGGGQPTGGLVLGLATASPGTMVYCMHCRTLDGGGLWRPIEVEAVELEEVPEERPPEPDAVVLTPGYIPPEQAPLPTPPRDPIVLHPTAIPDGCQWTRVDRDIACDPTPVGAEASPYRPAPVATTTSMPGPVASLIVLQVLALAAVGGFLWRHRRFLLAAPLFTRLKKDSLLDHPVRAQIHAIVEAEPGIHYNELLRRAASGRGALDHHLRALVDHGLLNEHATTGYRCYFISGAVDRRVMAARAALRAGLARELLQELCDHPGNSIGALAERAGVTPSAAAYHLHRFADVGLVELLRKGRKVEVHPGPVAQQMLATA